MLSASNASNCGPSDEVVHLDSAFEASRVCARHDHFTCAQVGCPLSKTEMFFLWIVKKPTEPVWRAVKSFYNELIENYFWDPKIDYFEVTLDGSTYYVNFNSVSTEPITIADTSTDSNAASGFNYARLAYSHVYNSPWKWNWYFRSEGYSLSKVSFKSVLRPILENLFEEYVMTKKSPIEAFSDKALPMVLFSEFTSNSFESCLNRRKSTTTMCHGYLTELTTLKQRHLKTSRAVRLPFESEFGS